MCKSCIADKKAEALKWHETNCGECSATIKYHEDWSRVPDLCKSCIQDRKRRKEEALAKWQEKACAECQDPVKYHMDWDKIPSLCKPCIERKKQEKAERLASWKEKTCSKCSQAVSYNINWSRIPDLCKLCLESFKAERAKWKVRNCEHCSSEFKYNTDWEKIPTHCKSCNQFQSRKCHALNCNEVIQFKIYWENIPDYCLKCKSGERKIKEVRIRKDGTKDIYEGRGYTNKQGVIVFRDDLSEGKHSHKVIRADGIEVGHRDKGKDKEWIDGLWKEIRCKQCYSTFKIHIDWDKPPDWCDDCRAEAKRKKEEERSKWIEVSCANEECGKKFRYHQSWSNAPNLCRQCSPKKIHFVEKEARNVINFKAQERVEEGDNVYRQDRLSGDKGEKDHRDHYWHKVNKDTGKSSEGYAGKESFRERDKTKINDKKEN